MVGMPLWGASRAADMEMFAFGEKHNVPDIRRGKQVGTREVGDYALHVQCAWRIAGPKGIVVGSTDRFYAAGDNPYYKLDEVDWEDRPGENRSDEHRTAFFEERKDSPLIVQEVWADSVGSIALALSDGYTLEVFPHNSLEREHWRLFQPATDEPHFVVTGAGIED